MENNTFFCFQGKNILITNISILGDIANLEMLWEFVFDNYNYSIVFRNVSRINMVDFSYPLQISCLEIESNKEKGWESASNYRIWDFEENSISFFCESFQLISG